MSARRLAMAVAASTAILAPLFTAAPAEAAPIVKIAKIHYAQTGTDLDTEYIVFKNTTTTTQRMTGWKVISSPATDDEVYKFGRTRLRPGASITLYTGHGTNTRTKRYWGLNDPAWNNDGDYAVLKNKAGATVDTCRYAGGGTTAYC